MFGKGLNASADASVLRHNDITVTDKTTTIPVINKSRYVVTFRQETMKKAMLLVKASDEKDAIRQANASLVDSDWEVSRYSSSPDVMRVRDTTQPPEREEEADDHQ